MVFPNLSFIPHIISDEEMAVMTAAFARSAEEKAAACCSVTHPLTFTRDGIDFVITQPENMGESIKLEIVASRHGEPVPTDDVYYWPAFPEVCADGTLNWVTALQEAIYAVVAR